MFDTLSDRLTGVFDRLRGRGALNEGDVREAFQTAVDEVEVQEDEHLTWAQDTRCRMISLQSTSGPATSLTMKAEEIVARIRSLFE